MPKRIHTITPRPTKRKDKDMEITGRMKLYRNGIVFAERVYKSKRGRKAILEYWQGLVTDNATWEYGMFPDDTETVTTQQGNIKRPLVLA